MSNNCMTENQYMKSSSMIVIYIEVEDVDSQQLN